MAKIEDSIDTEAETALESYTTETTPDAAPKAPRAVLKFDVASIVYVPPAGNAKLLMQESTSVALQSSFEATTAPEEFMRYR